MVVSSFSDPIALVCPPMVGKNTGRAALKLLGTRGLSSIKHMQSRQSVFEEHVRHSLLCVTGTPLHLHPTALGQLSSASSAAGRSLAGCRCLHTLPPRGIRLSRTCLASVSPDYLTRA